MKIILWRVAQYSLQLFHAFQSFSEAFFHIHFQMIYEHTYTGYLLTCLLVNSVIDVVAHKTGIWLPFEIEKSVAVAFPVKKKRTLVRLILIWLVDIRIM